MQKTEKTPEHKKGKRAWLSDAWWRGFWSAFSFFPSYSSRWYDFHDSRGLRVIQRNPSKLHGFDDDFGAIAEDMKKVLGDFESVLNRVKLGKDINEEK